MKKSVLTAIIFLFTFNVYCQKQRIVSLTPAGTEIVCAVGAMDSLVARTDFCNFPEEVKNIPSVGGFDASSFSVEKILSFKPDFVYATKGMHDQLVKQLKIFNVEVYLSQGNSVEGVLEEILYIGKITGHENKALDVKKSIEEKIALVKEKYDGQKKVSVYYEVWNSPYMSAGNTSFINELISYAGGKNIFEDLKDAYPLVSEEEIILRQPEVILLPDQNGVLPERLKKRHGWKKIPAVSKKHVYLISSDLCSRPCPRIVDAIEDIAEKIHR